MLFKRRNALPFLDKLLNLVRPRKGYMRAIEYLKKRFYRMTESNYSMAMGFTCGAILSFTPFVGFHFIIAGFIAYLINASIFMAALGTLVGNPWTFPLMWWGSLKIGNLALSNLGYSIFTNNVEVNNIFSDIYSIMIPWIVGSFIISLILGPLIYLTVYWTIKILRARFNKKQK
ncbi:DUF2062 domain-containing protein [Alphaproteobacteria bacterium]|jgi:uncharacterized protein|nr:DUF2062 domain-containing protein [Alphaproteobacteria bacterium]MBT5798502.1 DUF2062 domain-containing protein [Alphaproteobacteria bacterium]MDA9190148.1 DUF2062 domain-containing protein [Alphaproteobacteria bacterium]MDA9815520.1 DUF2062 domain-containing protein [Alphaproteobacteria bacterium]MDC0394773.1 DUF2062 domain-containing protein [Alphaproteobacteria bacterium]